MGNGCPWAFPWHVTASFGCVWAPSKPPGRSDGVGHGGRDGGPMTQAAVISHQQSPPPPACSMRATATPFSFPPFSYPTPFAQTQAPTPPGTRTRRWDRARRQIAPGESARLSSVATDALLLLAAAHRAERKKIDEGPFLCMPRTSRPRHPNATPPRQHDESRDRPRRGLAAPAEKGAALLGRGCGGSGGPSSSSSSTFTSTSSRGRGIDSSINSGGIAFTTRRRRRRSRIGRGMAGSMVDGPRRDAAATAGSG